MATRTVRTPSPRRLATRAAASALITAIVIRLVAVAAVFILFIGFIIAVAVFASRSTWEGPPPYESPVRTSILR